MQERVTLAVDLGGTKTAVAVVSQSGVILARLQEPTGQDGPGPGIDQLERMARAAAAAAGWLLSEIDCVGIGIPAVLEEGTDRVIWAPNISGWRDFDLRGQLSGRLGLPVYMEYDGHTAALAEWWLGVGRGCRSLVSVIIGTGIGGGMILDGHLYRGMNRLAGAAGWFALTENAMDQDGRSQSLGHWESLAAGPGMAMRAQSGLSEQPGSLLHDLAKDHEISCADILSAAKAGDRYGMVLANQLADWLGLGIANIVSLINPECVILGGGVGSNVAILLDRIRSVVQRWAQPVSARSVQISVSQLGSTAGLLGAAYGAMLRRQAEKPAPFPEKQ